MQSYWLKWREPKPVTDKGYRSNQNQAAIPVIIATTAPALLERFQYMPNTIGTKSETRLRIDETPTSS